MSDILRDLFNDFKFSPNKEFSANRIKRAILNLYLRNYSFHINSTLEDSSPIKNISQVLSLPSRLVEEIIETFRLDIRAFLRFVSVSREWRNPNRTDRSLRIYLHKLHRVAPVFDYKRARSNLNALSRFLHKCNFSPKIRTQLACVVYVTDFKEKNTVKLRQTNVRTITGCSAYAFHKIRNVLSVDALLQK